MTGGAAAPSLPPAARRLRCAGRSLDLSRPVVMGVVNVTPDSFSDGGCFDDPGRAIEQGLRLHEEGAAILDIGGESTRPGADAVSAEQELARVLPVIEGIHRHVDALISIDTSKPRVMREAVAAGAVMINDVMALRAPGALETAAGLDAGLCLMHMQGSPRTMQANPVYRDVVAEVRAFLAARLAACATAGIDRARLLVDPGFGFGKTLDHNMTLLRGLGALTTLGPPVLVGLSRKSFVGRITGQQDMAGRVYGSIGFALAALHQGAAIVRVHDVRATVDAIKVWNKLYA